MHTDDTTLNTFDLLNTADLIDGLCASVDAARVAAEGNTRWLAALDTAYGYLLQQEVISFDLAALALRVESASAPGKAYIANGECACRSFAEGNACWHRAAARLVRRALEWHEARDLAARSFTDEADEADEAYRAAFRAGLVGVALEWHEARELADLAAELVADAADAGCAGWYDLPTGIVGAEARMASLRDFAERFDAVSLAQRSAFLNALTA